MPVIEDCAQAMGARWQGRTAGTLGRAGCYSFYANKIITTGEGGMVVTNDAALAERLRGVRNYGQVDEPFVHHYFGLNFKMTNVQAAIGLAQLDRIETFIEQRRAFAASLTDALRGHPWLALTPVDLPDCRSVFFSNWLVFHTPAQAAAARAALERDGVETRPFFSLMPDHEPYRSLGYQAAVCMSILIEERVEIPRKSFFHFDSMNG